MREIEGNELLSEYFLMLEIADSATIYRDLFEYQRIRELNQLVWKITTFNHLAK